MRFRGGRGTSGSRGSLLQITYVGLAIPVMAAAMFAVARGYVVAFGLTGGEGVPGLHVIGLMLGMLAAIPIGLSIGGWLWAAVGKGLFRFTRSEVEAFVMRGPRLGPLVRYNDWCLKKLFGHEQG